jgi:preprotein translocase subunit YajC
VIEILAQTSQPAGGTGNPLYEFVHNVPMVILVIGFLVFYFVMILPKRKQDKERQSMLTNMKRGDEVETIGGIIGKVVDPKEDRVLVKVDESSNTKIWFRRSSIAKVTVEDTKTTVSK